MMNKIDREVLRKIQMEDGVVESQDNSSFTFLISPSITIGVEIRLLAHAFKNIVFRRLKQLKFESPITGFVFFPTIIDPKISAREPVNKISYKRKEKCYFIAWVIPYFLWNDASCSERVDLLSNNLVDSLKAVPDKHLFKSEKQEIIKIVEETRSYLVAF